MEEQWCTPEEFVRMDDDISFESWDNDIRVNGVSLKELIKVNCFLIMNQERYSFFLEHYYLFYLFI